MLLTVNRQHERDGRVAWPGSTLLIFLAAVGLSTAAAVYAQDAQPVETQAQTQAAATSTGAAQPAVITLDEAIRRAEDSDPAYAAARANQDAASLDRSIARSGLLPSVVYHNQALYTQPNGLTNQAGQGAQAQPAPRFIANNAVREYASQAWVNETLGLAGAAAVRRADAAAAQAAAEQEIAHRGLIAAVTGLFFSSLAADRKLAVAEQARQQSANFLRLTGEREQAREAAHADVVKAQIEDEQRRRDLEDARVLAGKARLELGVLLFPDPRTPYKLSAAEPAPALANQADVEQAAAKNNPELKSALAALRVSDADVLAARAAYLPDLGLNVTYGMDAPQIAVNGPDGVRNLGYSASVTLDIPVWDWLATGHKVKQSEIRRDAARVELSAAQRRLIADLDDAYSEAAAARDQLASLDRSAAMAAESLRLTTLRYQGGEATVLEVVDAQSTYVLAEDARADGRVRYETARAALETLTGTM
ncbi:MAG TPA: TolC family protein [Terracidiphilus sp.]|jgi:outer membrane protein TolC|nr:TolC family protein [Terracidiphilus sp.]